MDIAYLVVVHDNPSNLPRLIDSLQDTDVAFFIHVDAKADIEAFRSSVLCHDNVFFVDRRVSVNWGGWSLVQATLNTMEAAVSVGQYNRYVLLSGACLPLTSAANIKHFFRGNANEYISVRPFPDLVRHKPRSRLTKIYIEGGDRTSGLKARFKQLLNCIMKILPERPIEKILGDYNAFSGSNWWALTHDAVSLIRRAIVERPDIVSLFRTSKIPDESFFHTIIASELGAENLKRGLTYVDWSDANERPAYIRRTHLENLRDANLQATDDYGHGPVLFARKFGTKNDAIAVELVEELSKDMIFPIEQAEPSR